MDLMGIWMLFKPIFGWKIGQRQSKMFIFSIVFIIIIFCYINFASSAAPQLFLVDGIQIEIPPYNDTIVPKSQFDIKTAGRVQRIIRQYFEDTKDYIQVSIKVRDTIGRGLAKTELRKALRQILEEEVAKNKKLPQEMSKKMLAEFDDEFRTENEEIGEKHLEGIGADE